MIEEKFIGESLFMIRTFKEVASAIKARRPELVETVEDLERDLDNERQVLGGTTNRQEALNAVEKIFDLRDALAKFSNNPSNIPEAKDSLS